MGAHSSPQAPHSSPQLDSASFSSHMSNADKNEMSSKHVEDTSKTSKPSTIDDGVEPTLHWRTWAVVIACGGLLFADNFGILATGFWLSYVVAGIGGGGISIWFATAAVVVQVAFMPIVGLMADMGAQTRRYMTIIFGLIAAVGLFVAGSANTMNVGIVGTAFFSFSIINYATCFAIVSEVVPHRSKGLGQAVLYCFTALGGVLGGLAGGAIVRDNVGGKGGWRWNLYLCGILHVVASATLWLFYRPLPDKKVYAESYLKRVSRLDWVGCALFMTGWVPILVAINQGANTQLWRSAAVLAPMVTGVALFCVFIGHQVFIKKDGVLNHRLFAHRNFALAMASIFIEGWYLIPFSTFIGNFINALYEQRPLQFGVHGAVLWLASIATSAFCGWYSKKYRRVKELIFIGWIFIAVAMIGLSRCTIDPNDGKLAYGMIALAGLGLGVQLTLLVATCQLAVPADLMGICSALFCGIRSAGASVGIAISSAVFTAKISKNLPTELGKAAAAAGVAPADIPAVIGAFATSDATAIAALGLTPEQAGLIGKGALTAFAKSFPFVWYIILSGVLAILVVTLFFGEVKSFMSWEIDLPVEKDEDLGLSRAQDSGAAREVEKA